jgi:hypothetical protein
VFAPPPLAHPPFALEPTGFRFPALAALAGRAAIGGQREVALATYLAARLAHDTLTARVLVQPVRAERANGARHWLSSLALPPAVKQPLARLVDATAGESPAVAAALRTVIAVTASFLDSGARSELDHLATALDAQAVVK